MPRPVDFTPPHERVLRRILKDPETGCWEFQGYRNKKGYGVCGSRRTRGTTSLAHRIVYKALVSDVADDLQVCHRCDNPPCVNPDHLFAGTVQENWADMVKKGRSRWLKHEENPNSKLERRQVEEILALRGLVPSPELARWFGVNRSTITKVWRGVSWSREPSAWELAK